VHAQNGGADCSHLAHFTAREMGIIVKESFNIGVLALLGQYGLGGLLAREGGKNSIISHGVSERFP
jgi:hypothetical protein